MEERPDKPVLVRNVDDSLRVYDVSGVTGEPGSLVFYRRRMTNLESGASEVVSWSITLHAGEERKYSCTYMSSKPEEGFAEPGGRRYDFEGDGRLRRIFEKFPSGEDEDRELFGAALRQSTEPE
jgi:hypothetical protein